MSADGGPRLLLNYIASLFIYLIVVAQGWIHGRKKVARESWNCGMAVRQDTGQKQGDAWAGNQVGNVILHDKEKTHYIL